MEVEKSLVFSLPPRPDLSRYYSHRSLNYDPAESAYDSWLLLTASHVTAAIGHLNVSEARRVLAEVSKAVEKESCEAMVNRLLDRPNDVYP